MKWKWYMAKAVDSRGVIDIYRVIEKELPLTSLQDVVSDMLEIPEEDREEWWQDVASNEFGDVDDQVLSDGESIWAFSSTSSNDASYRLFQHIANDFKE